MNSEKKNENVLQHCITEITRITDLYKAQMRKRTNVQNDKSIQDDVFKALYHERKIIKGKYIYKNIVQNVIGKRVFSQFNNANQLVRFFPKSKFEQMCVQFEHTLVPLSET